MKQSLFASYRKRGAFTLLELIFVLIVLGIVSSIGAEIIAQVYESYIIQRAQYRAGIKTELVLNQIANRLRYAVPGTIGARDTVSSTEFTPITEVNGTAQRNVLQWVGADGDSFEAITSSTDRKPGWSGFIDLDQSTASTLVSPGSNFDLANEIITNLGGSFTSAKLYFPYGLAPVSITSASGENIQVSGLASGSTIVERYKLAWSSYAIVFENGTLWLYHHFAPNYAQALGTTRNRLLSNVTSFSFKGSESSLVIKVCQYEYIDNNASITDDSAHSCKEKVILF